MKLAVVARELDHEDCRSPLGSSIRADDNIAVQPQLVIARSCLRINFCLLFFRLPRIA